MALDFSLAEANAFAIRWAEAESEESLKQPFWLDLVETVFGFNRPLSQGLEFERKVKVIEAGRPRLRKLDVYWQNFFLVEHKSSHVNLNEAEEQGRAYLRALPPADRPPYLILCNFRTFRVIDLASGRAQNFDLDQLATNIGIFVDVFSATARELERNTIDANEAAAQLLGNLYRELIAKGYDESAVSKLVDRLLFCFYADDTFLWRYGYFHELLLSTREDGQGLGQTLDSLFEVLDTPKDQRDRNIEPRLAEFPYVNGGLFSEPLPSFFLDREIRGVLLEASTYKWSNVNTTIFGALFQASRTKTEGRIHGRHYTPESRIRGILAPLFTDELNARLGKAWDSVQEIVKFRIHLSSVKVFDPACGSGNFLIVAFKILRQLDHDSLIRLMELQGKPIQGGLLSADFDFATSLNQLYGIELEEWSAGIAKVALVLTETQLNSDLEARIGYVKPSLPIPDLPNIRIGNSLRIDWTEVCKPDNSTYVVGNPPFRGREKTEEQKEDTDLVWGQKVSGRSTDYVANWFIKASRFMGATLGATAFVSTNSIAQGHQPALIWPLMQENNSEIFFAMQTFPWESDAKGKASVHCVAIGFRNFGAPGKKKLWHAVTTPSEKQKLELVENIGPYLESDSTALISPRSSGPLCELLPLLLGGSKPRDGGYISSITEEEATQIRATDPVAAKYLRRIVGSDELLAGTNRYCLWLGSASPTEIKGSTILRARIEQVRLNRQDAANKAEGKPSPKRDALARPHLFAEDHQPNVEYLAIPAVSSISRRYIPMDYLSPDVIANNRLYMLPGASRVVFGLLQTRAFAVWANRRGGKLKSDYQIAAKTVYNTYPVPKLTELQQLELSNLAQNVLDSRAEISMSLGDMYKEAYMPAALKRAHAKLDSFVNNFFDLAKNPTDDEIFVGLETAYHRLTDPSNVA